MRRVKDSYNCDAIAIAAATAALQDQEWMLANRDKILSTRLRMESELKPRGFDVHPSEANFLWMTHASQQHETIYERLKADHILIRYMRFPGAERDGVTLEGLRISVGTDEEIDRLLESLDRILADL